MSSKVTTLVVKKRSVYLLFEGTKENNNEKLITKLHELAT